MFFSFVLVGVLTYLLFLSHQKGFDDQVIDPSSENKKNNLAFFKIKMLTYTYPQNRTKHEQN